jgi:metallophosphoesterase superfamily enzyme
VPAHSLRETTDRLESLLSRVETRVLIVAGDLVESDHTQARREARELESWLQSRGVELIRLRGNHDGAEGFVVPTVTVDGWTICHGDRPIVGLPAIVGHHHPCVRLGAHRMRCFLHGPRLIVLPAFSENAAGQEVGSLKGEGGCEPLALRCAVVAGDEIRDFGPWRELAGKLR